jgi:TonB family protein
MVDETGAISRIEIVRSSGVPSLDAEARRIIAAMPRWIPRQYKGRKARVLYLLPIIFRLN